MDGLLDFEGIGSLELQVDIDPPMPATSQQTAPAIIYNSGLYTIPIVRGVSVLVVLINRDSKFFVHW